MPAERPALRGPGKATGSYRVAKTARSGSGRPLRYAAPGRNKPRMDNPTRRSRAPDPFFGNSRRSGRTDGPSRRTLNAVEPSMKRDLSALAGASFDLVVIGGGITGAGVALDASLRGLRVALIDKGDFASGTSSISTKLVHGG